MFLVNIVILNITTGGYRVEEKKYYKKTYHFIVAGRPAMGNTLESESTTCSTMIWLNYNNNESKLSVNRRPAMGVQHIHIQI